MARENSLFGLRFDSDVELNPTSEELRVFLASTAKAGTRVTHGSDLMRYRALREDLLEYENGQRSDAPSQDVREKIFYAVIDHSQFANTGLELAVGQYKYHLSARAALDLRKPAAFIRSAEEELARLNPRKKEDAEKRVRLLGLLEERKRDLDLLRRRQQALGKELARIGRYVRDNLIKIEKLCEKSIVILADPRILQQEEKRLVDDIKEQFKEQLKDSLRHGQVSRQALEAARKDVDVLSREVSFIAKEDVSALTGLLQSVRDHIKEHACGIDRLLAEIAGGGDNSVVDDSGSFTALEGVLVSLVSGYRWELRTAALRSETAHVQVLEEARKDLLRHLVTLLEKDRRARSDRRSGEDRRRHREPHVEYTEQRSGRDRRSGKGRRSEPSEQ